MIISFGIDWEAFVIALPLSLVVTNDTIVVVCLCFELTIRRKEEAK